MGHTRIESGSAILMLAWPVALAIDYDVANRANHCRHDHQEVYQTCDTWGSMANEAATARLIGLDTA